MLQRARAHTTKQRHSAVDSSIACETTRRNKTTRRTNVKAHQYRLCVDIDTRFNVERYTNRKATMYPKIGSGATQPTAPPGPSAPLANSNAGKPVGFSSLVSELNNLHPSSYSGGPASQTPYPSGPPSSSGSYTNPYATSNPPANAGNYSPYSLPQTGQQQMPPSQGEL